VSMLGARTAWALPTQMVRSVVSVNKSVAAVSAAGLRVVVRPVRAGVRALSDEIPAAGMRRNCWGNSQRAWIEVRGLHDDSGSELGRAVVDAVGARHGVRSASVNRPLSRVIIELDAESPSLRDLCQVVEETETRYRVLSGHRGRWGNDRQPPLPGDGLLLAARTATMGADAAGIGIALIGRALRWPRLPVTVSAAVSALNHQPLLRGPIEDRIGQSSTDTLLKLVGTTTYILSLAPASLLVDLALETLKAGEYRAGAQAWRRHEPMLAAHAESGQVYPPHRPVPAPAGPIERHARRAALAQALAAATAGAASRNIDTAATAALVSAPKAVRATRESFAATLARGLAGQHDILTLRPNGLRRLDRVDALLVDPRVLCTDTLRVMRVRGACDEELSAAWSCAQELTERSDLSAGWHPIPNMAARDAGSDVEALITPCHDPMAQPVLAEARRARLTLVSVDIDAVGELRSAFDELHARGGSIDDALTVALADLQESGHTVAVVSSMAAQALASADVGLGVMSVSGATPPPWTADLMFPHLTGVWRLLHAVPAAKAASARGIEIATGASALGTLLMLPGVRGGGPGPVTSGAAAGVLSGYLLARRVLTAAEPIPAPVHEWHAMSVEQVLKLLAPSNPDGYRPAQPPPGVLTALMAATAQRRAQLITRPKDSLERFVTAVRVELSDPLTPVLALGSAASAILGSPVDAVLVGSVLSGNAVLAASQRLRAEARLDRLLALQVPPARKVVAGPDGEPRYIDVVAAELRPGDVIEVRTHEVVPADARLIEEDDLEIDESTLSGESLPVHKQVQATPGADLSQRGCMLHADTTVVAGTATGVVTAVGAQTQVRRAEELVSGETPTVGLQHQLSQLTNRAFPVSVGGGALVSTLALLRGRGLREAVASGVAVAVAAVPEGMPLVATLAQAASARRLTRYGALVRVPRSVEALGRVGVVCFDKTGTLSENRLRVAGVHATGGYTRGDVLRAAAGAAPDAHSGPLVHATDRAIIEAAYPGDSPEDSRPATEADAHLPFRSGRALSASVFGEVLTVKGAPEVVLAACNDIGADAEQAVRRLAAEGLRVIAVARRQLNPAQAKSMQDDEDVIADLSRENLSLVGLLGLSDTPRHQAADLLAALSRRQIPVRLITGDHPITAAAIARELGMTVGSNQVISGAEWDRLSRKDQERAVAERLIFARMSPEHKVQIVQTLERIDEVCAMVGDGSNDAAAIRAATVGIAVAARGSDPARVAADVVVVDERVEALLEALDEGNRLWQRVQAAVSVLLGGNAGEVGFAVLGTAITGTSPLNTRQLLLVNMMTDALPAAALAVSTPSQPLQHAGRGPDHDALWRAVAIRGTTTAAAATGAWAMATLTGRPRRASTVALVALVSAQLGQTLLESRTPLVILTAGGSLAAMGTLISTPGVSQLLGCTPLGPLGWAQALGAAGAATIAVPILTRAIADSRPEGADSRADGAESQRRHPAASAVPAARSARTRSSDRASMPTPQPTK